MEFKGRNFLVLGLGKTGNAAWRALARAGAEVWLWEDGISAKKEGPYIERLEDVPWPRLQAVVASPGISYMWPRPHAVIAEARRRFCPILSDVDVLRALAPESRFIAITGTNGKSTTTAWLGHVLAPELHCAVGGNIGLAALDLPLWPRQRGTYTLELSSYQLEISQIPLYTISVLLNISPDHLPRHGGLEGYITAKRKIFAHADGLAIVGIDSSMSCSIFKELHKDKKREAIPISGVRVPENGIGWRNGSLVDARTSETILSAENILPGEHNKQNCAAVYAAARAWGLAKTTISERLKSFRGLAHRQEQVLTFEGVTFINDSKATNADSVIPAFACFGQVYWIAGGRAKDDGILALLPHLHHVKKAFLIGEAAEDFAKILARQGVAYEVSHTIDRAVEAAFSAARRDAATSQTVLFAPACASFDQFKNFEERGEAFKQHVHALAGSFYGSSAQ